MKLMHFSRLLTIAAVGAFIAIAPAARATTTSFVGPFTSTNSITFSNWGSFSGLDLTVKCGVGSTIATGTLGGNTCTFDDANGVTTGTPLGVTSSGTGDSAWIDGHTTTANIEFVMFQFNNNVTLTNIGLNVSATSGWTLYSCSTTAVTSCTTVLTSATNTAANTNFTSSTFSSIGKDFAIIANNSTTTAFGINSLTYTATTTPEPATLGMVGITLLGLGGLHLRRRTARAKRSPAASGSETA